MTDFSSKNANHVEYPITCIVGDRGSGKTLFMTALAVQYASEGHNIYSNYELTGIKYTPLSFKELATIPESLTDAVILLDEVHVGVDSYDFFTDHVRNISAFILQLRKRRITLFYTTQTIDLVAKRLRQQTNYIMQVEPLEERGTAVVSIFDHSKSFGSDFIRTLLFDGRQFYGFYNTNEVVAYD